MPMDVILARLEKALGREAMAAKRKKLQHLERPGMELALEEWRQKELGRMFSLSEFVKCVKFRFTRWYNKRTGHRGGLWDGRFGSVIVEDGERTLKPVALYIDLNPVRAGIVSDPADYRWSGYSEAMAGKPLARRGLVQIIGQAAWPRDTAASAKPWGREGFPPPVERRALVYYRALLGGQGAERKREDGTVIRKGLSEKVRERLTTPGERQLAAEILKRRVAHFTRGVLIGSRSFIDNWFEANRDRVKGRSRTERKRGSQSLGLPALRELYAFRRATS